ncbi:hypothetical protein AB0873_16385 [Micromonospora sp. NPDC047707]|uniref:hypothetical protein n=1 Tax=Micromonospora sp. NPDC047707 TaxID=3154498 RepID=UPI0034549C7D
MILRALHDFYTTAVPVLAAMIERAQAQRDSTADDRRAELTATANQITHTENAITCYHTAFENGTMDDATAGPRIRSANGSPNSRPGTPNSTPTRPPSPRPAARHRRPHPRPPRHHSGERHHHRAQAAIETLIAEVQLTDQGVVPVFKIPTDTTMPPPETDGGTSKEPPVRTMVRSVGRQGLEP